MLASSNDADCSMGDEHSNRISELLVAALEILDEHVDAPDLGARLQGIIDSLAERRSG